VLRYTGHPLVDIGIATIVAFARKGDPGEITEADLGQVTDYIAREYVQEPLSSFLTVAFPNSGWVQPSYRGHPEKRGVYAQRLLHAYSSDTPRLDARCAFTGEQVADVPFDVKGDLKPGRAYRQHVPMLTGVDVINFFPGGEAGLPVSGLAILALQALPLGCAKCAGRLLAVHSDNAEITQHFAATFLEQNRRAVQLAQRSGSSKMPEARLSHRTLLVDLLLQAHGEQRDARGERLPFSVTAYHLTNFGQQPKLDIYQLPLQITAFLIDTQTARYRDQWNAIVRRAWQVAPTKKGGKQDEQGFEPRSNWLYEDLFRLPGNAREFLRTYFLREALRYARSDRGDPRGGYSLKDEAGLVSWGLTECFLWRVLNMDKGRIEQIRTMGDQLADYVASQNDRRFFQSFYMERRYDWFRNALIKANLAQVKRGHAPIITLDPYIEVFEEGDDVARSDWQLARDLVLIRMVERLYKQGWLGRNVDVITESSEEETQAA
jgi:CRISPR-associated protein Cst1